MPQFRNTVTQGEYRVGCADGTVYIYRGDTLLAHFDAMGITYQVSISPDERYVAVKNVAGEIDLYTLEAPAQAAHLQIQPAASQNGMLLFSHAGDMLVSVDEYDDIHSCVRFYAVPTLETVAVLWRDSDRSEPRVIERAPMEELYFAIGEQRDADGLVDSFYLSPFSVDGELDRIEIAEDEYDLCREDVPMSQEREIEHILTNLWQYHKTEE